MDGLFTFASEAEIVLLWAIGFIALAALAAYAERRRGKRRAVDRVGFMPWLGIFFGSAFIGAGLLVMAVKGLLAG